MISLTVFDAKGGDSFLVSFGKENNTNILIDTGFVSTYTNDIKEALMSLSKNNKKLDLMVITHVDQDHIQGGLKLIKENEYKKVDGISVRSIIEVQEVWHNTYRHLKYKYPMETMTEETERKLKKTIMVNQPNMHENGTKEISVLQGVSFGGYLIKDNYNWNTSFDGEAVQEPLKKVLIGEKVEITLLSPNSSKLDALAELWREELITKLKVHSLSDNELYDDAFEFYMQKLSEDLGGTRKIASSSNLTIYNIEELSKMESEDDSVVNGSSISFIIEYDEKRLLFLADAHEDIIYESLEEIKGSEEFLFFDLIKVSHHGSKNNISNRLASIARSNRYLFSTDGKKHNHPNFETIAKILFNNPNENKLLIFNHRIDKLLCLENEELKDKYNYNVVYLDGNNIIEII